MNAEQAHQQSSHITQKQLLSCVREMIGGKSGREDDEHPLPPGPWDPVTRAALERSIIFGPAPNPWEVFGPLPDPWKFIVASIVNKHPAIWDVIGGGAEAAYNPQLLPPRFAFLACVAQTVISHAELINETADTTRHEVEQRGTTAAGDYISKFVDDICGNDFRFSWPFPWPRPNWLAMEVSGIDLVVMATQFDQAANEAFNANLRQNLADASAKLAEAGLSNMK
ncbi:hypothetical protein PS850_06160 [Pseudomonas fluorescens]|nr:hypothetical protein PS850_06160 [Pseudomonas fluorescens]